MDLVVLIQSILLCFMVVGAIIAIEIRDLLSSVIVAGLVGYALTAVFLLLQAPDVAIVQAGVETITLVILVAALAKTTREGTPSPWMSTGILLGLVFLVIFIGTFSIALVELPAFGNPAINVTNYYFQNAVQETGAINLVSSIILDFRGYDTLGEAIVLFTSALGVAAVLRGFKLEKGGKEE